MKETTQAAQQLDLITPRSGFRRWFRLPRKLKVTREGKYFIAITFGVGFAAVNTGNNLLYLLLGMLLSLIVVSSIMSEMSLRHLTVSRRLPPRAQVNRPHLVEIEVHNHKRRMPSYAIEIEDLRRGQPADKRCFFLKISPGSSQVAAYRRTPARRGRDQHVGFRVATRFPFGFFEKSRELSLDGELIIYPAVDPVALPLKLAGTRVSGHGNLNRGHGDDILTIRPMRDGDEPREIYWRRSANQLVVRERSLETESDVTLTLDTLPPLSESAEEWRRHFELKIRDIASRAVAHIKRGDAVTIRTQTDRVRADRSVGADPLLRFLALIQPPSGVVPPEPTHQDPAEPIHAPPPASEYFSAGRLSPPPGAGETHAEVGPAEHKDGASRA
ncbi:MAG: hypothetical protein RJA70_4434 [Pseudomonadota bacterium]